MNNQETEEIFVIHKSNTFLQYLKMGTNNKKIGESKLYIYLAY